MRRLTILALAASFAPSGAFADEDSQSSAAASQATMATLEEGRRIFRYDTFGDEDFWGGKLKLHKAIAGSDLGGVGAGVSPKTALSVGLKVDSEALPQSVIDGIRANTVDLNSPETTL